MRDWNIFSGAVYLILVLLLIGPFESWGQRNKRNESHTGKLTSSDIRQAEYYFTEGQKYFILEDYAKSYVLFQQSLEIDESNAAAHYKIAQILSHGDEMDKALQSINEALRLDNKNKYYYLLAADLYTRNSNFERAAEVYEELINSIPGNEEYYFDLAAIYLYQNKMDLALDTYQKIENKYGINEQSTFQKQKILLSQNKLDESIEEGKRLIEAFPGESQYVIALIEIMVSNERYPDATELLKDHLQSNPENSRARLILADIYLKRNDFMKAKENMVKSFSDPALDVNMKIKILSKYLSNIKLPEFHDILTTSAEVIVETHPESNVARTTLGDIYLQTDEKESAITEYLESIRLDDSNFVVWQNVLNLEMDLNRIDSVLKHSEQALELFPNQNAFYYFNGIANYQKKRYEEAAFSLEQGRKLSSTNLKLRIFFDTMLGDTYNYLENYTKSDEAYERVLADDPNNYGVLNNYSYFLSLRNEKLDLAKKMSAKLIKDNPDNPTYLDTHAWVLFMLEEYKEARKIMEKALKSESVNGVHYEHYGDILYRLGDIDGAVEQWNKAKGMNSASDLIDKKIADKKLYE